MKVRIFGGMFALWGVVCSCNDGHAQFAAPQQVVRPQSSTEFGIVHAVALLGDRAAIMAALRSSSSATVFVFERSDEHWELAAEFACPPYGGTQSGHSLRLTDNSIIAGTPEGTVVLVFENRGDGWAETQRLRAPDFAPGQKFGASLAVEENTLVIGAPVSSNEGPASSVYVYTLSEEGWTFQQKLLPEEAGFRKFGAAVAISNGVIAVGESLPFNDSGTVYLFENDAVEWQLTQVLRPPALPGDRRRFGESLSLIDEVLVVGASRDSRQQGRVGAAYVYRRDGDAWVFQQELRAADAVAEDRFGESISVTPGTILVGAPYHDGIARDSGLVYVFEEQGGSWTEAQRLTSRDVEISEFGISVVFDGRTVLVGASSAMSGGAAFFYDHCEGSGDCNENGLADDCEIADGSSRDCDGNGVLDECDLAAGAVDCDEDGLLDRCALSLGVRVDCNGNDVIDRCEVPVGTSSDVNGNGIPDACETFNEPFSRCRELTGLLDCDRSGVDDRCEVFTGVLADIDANDIPDVCQVDCDGSGVPDSYELSTGMLFDCDGNGLPDVCDTGPTPVSLQATEAIPFGISSTGVVLGDWNADSLIDLAVTHDSAGVVSIAIGESNGGFTVNRSYPVGDVPIGIVAADLDGDGTEDLATANRSANTVSILFGRGDATFRPAGSLLVGQGPEHIVASDFNNDDAMDLAIAEVTFGTISVLLGYGDGTFHWPVRMALDGAPTALLATRLDDDDHVDLVASVSLSGVSLFSGIGDGTFVRPRKVAVGGTFFGVVATDLDQNSIVDLVTLDGESNIHAFLGTSGGLCQRSDTAPAGELAVDLTSGDWDQDGNTEIAVLAERSAAVFMFEWLDDRFVSLGDFPAGANRRAIASADGATGADPVVATIGAGGLAPVMTNDEAGRLSPVQRVDLDGAADVAVIHHQTGPPTLAVADRDHGAVHLVPITGPETFGAPQTISFDEGTATEIESLHVNADGLVDLAVLRTQPSRILLLMAEENRTFTAGLELPVDGTTSLIATDLSSDRIDDLVVANHSMDDVSIYVSRGDGTFETELRIPVGPQPGRLVAGDLNGDGLVDLVVSHDSRNAFYVLVGEGQGKFLPVQRIQTNSSRLTGIAVGDWDGDGLGDVITTHQREGAEIYFYVDGGGFESPGRVFEAELHVIVPADVDGDGQLDVVGSGANDVFIALGRGDGRFLPPQHFIVGQRVLGLVTDDLDDDDRVDIVTANSAFQIAEINVLRNHTVRNDSPLLNSCADGAQLVGDCTQDAVLDISDGICVLGVLFSGEPVSFPCDDGLGNSPGNLALLDIQPDGDVDISDAISLFQFLFVGSAGETEVVRLDNGCERIVGCPNNIACGQ